MRNKYKYSDLLKNQLLIYYRKGNKLYATSGICKVKELKDGCLEAAYSLLDAVSKKNEK